MAAAERITFADFQERFKTEEQCQAYLFCSGFRTDLCAPLAVRKSIIPSTAAIFASARNAASKLL